MPRYARLNALGNRRHLPWFYWTGETDLNCLRQVIHQTRREALSHHIQRLMVTGCSFPGVSARFRRCRRGQRTQAHRSLSIVDGFL